MTVSNLNNNHGYIFYMTAVVQSTKQIEGPQSEQVSFSFSSSGMSVCLSVYTHACVAFVYTTCMYSCMCCICIYDLYSCMYIVQYIHVCTLYSMYVYRMQVHVCMYMYVHVVCMQQVHICIHVSTCTYM